MNLSVKTSPDADLERQGIDVIRALAMDGPHRARSGHQGTAMALAPLAHVLFTRVLRYDATDPGWPDRDRFVLSAGHASILLYSMLYLTGQGLQLDDLREFRQWGSATPGHPEAGHSSGVEVTTGPLGQGFGNAVGMAIAERWLRARFGRDLCDHHTFVIAGDGDLSEGVSHEAASLAGHLGLGRLVVVYDDNHVTIDGPTELALSDDAAARFAGYGWHVDDIGERADDLDELEAALRGAKTAVDRPSLIILRSRIGYPSPGLTDSPSAHGNPFDDAEIAATKARMGMPLDESFWVPDQVLDFYRAAGRGGAAERASWQQRLDALDSDRPAWDASWAATGLTGWADALPSFESGDALATRKASQQCLTALSDVVPSLLGGSADLTGNTGTKIDEVSQTPSTPAGRQIYFGVREHAMAAALVGAARHGGVIPFGGTFLVFSDYMRPAVRLAAMSQAKCIFVWTHDSVGVGEDGPTHQPVEHIMSLRAIPGLRVVRPADATEVAGAWQLALSSDGPTALILSRQDVPGLAATTTEGVGAGAYALNDVDDPEVILVGSGSEVALCVAAEHRLAEQGIVARVVSMPCWEAFESLPSEARHAVIDPDVPAISIEAGVTLGWDRYVDVAIGIDTFGASAPGSRVLEELGINVDHLVSSAVALVEAADLD
ncbi:MAG: transketolase [Acidimicrobiia bacterium]|nr:transketolase [Acidimicrobiia bacterium]